jgi:hypothetical protein
MFLWLTRGSLPAKHESPFSRAAIPQKENTMLSSPHTSALETKHAGLDARLREEMGRPAPDAGTIQQLKREKLRIKEQLSQI